jgi:hypothetical protein
MRSYSSPIKALNCEAVKIGSCSCARFEPRALSSAVDIASEILFLPHAPSYSAGCNICWSINLHLLCAKVVFLFRYSTGCDCWRCSKNNSEETKSVDHFLPHPMGHGRSGTMTFNSPENNVPLLGQKTYTDCEPIKSLLAH